MKIYQKIQEPLEGLNLGKLDVSVNSQNSFDHLNSKDENDFDRYLTISTYVQYIKNEKGEYVEYYLPFENVLKLIKNVCEQNVDNQYKREEEVIHEVTIPYKESNQKNLDLVLTSLKEGLKEAYQKDEIDYERYLKTLRDIKQTLKVIAYPKADDIADLVFVRKEDNLVAFKTVITGNEYIDIALFNKKNCSFYSGYSLDPQTTFLWLIENDKVPYADIDRVPEFKTWNRQSKIEKLI